jgi:hypothetical protein
VNGGAARLPATRHDSLLQLPIQRSYILVQNISRRFVNQAAGKLSKIKGVTKQHSSTLKMGKVGTSKRP